MKSTFYFLIVFFFGILGTTSTVARKELSEPKAIIEKVSYNYETDFAKEKAKNLLSKFIYNQKLIKNNTEQAQENINFVKNKNQQKNEHHHHNHYQYYVQWHSSLCQ